MHLSHSLIFFLCFTSLLVTHVRAECVRLPDGTWRCIPTAPPSEPAAQPVATDVRVQCPTARGSATSVARSASGGTLIVTNHHVIRGQSSITLHSGSGATATATVAAIDEANDLALLEVAASWTFVTLGDEVPIGTHVQFRAFDAGTLFRKYYGQVTNTYQGQGTAGYFATGTSRPGNSGGGVYSQGRLVGVVWGNPDGGTAFVPIGPVKQLIERVNSQHLTQKPPTLTPLERLPVFPSPQPQAPSPQACDCDTRLARIEQQLTTLQKQNISPSAPATSPPASVPPAPASSATLGLVTLVAGALGVSTPIGLAIVVAGALLRTKLKKRERGPGGPRDQTFHESTATTTHPEQAA
ncbi:S1 family peptidase [Aeoliella sp. SH292]|uniref:S1 family peptidase n=1 Tax=Aeoliella sp. SH292 TaxID=3454464 RepID=UPI003F99D95D